MPWTTSTAGSSNYDWKATPRRMRSGSIPQIGLDATSGVYRATHLAQRIEVLRVLLGDVGVDPAESLLQDHVHERVVEGDVGAGLDAEVVVRVICQGLGGTGSRPSRLRAGRGPLP